MNPKESPGSGKPLFLNDDVEEEIRDMIHVMDPSTLVIGNKTDNPAEFVFDDMIIRWSEVPVQMLDKTRGYFLMKSTQSEPDHTPKPEPEAAGPTGKPAVRTDTKLTERTNQLERYTNLVGRNPLWNDDETVPPYAPHKPNPDSDLAKDEADEEDDDRVIDSLPAPVPRKVTDLPDEEDTGDDNSDLMVIVPRPELVQSLLNPEPTIAPPAMMPTPAPAPVRVTAAEKRKNPYPGWGEGGDVDDSPTTGSRHNAPAQPVHRSVGQKPNGLVQTATREAQPVTKPHRDLEDSWFNPQTGELQDPRTGELADQPPQPPVPEVDPDKKLERLMTDPPKPPSPSLPPPSLPPRDANKRSWAGIALAAAAVSVVAALLCLGVVSGIGRSDSSDPGAVLVKAVPETVPSPEVNPPVTTPAPVSEPPGTATPTMSTSTTTVTEVSPPNGTPEADPIMESDEPTTFMVIEKSYLTADGETVCVVAHLMGVEATSSNEENIKVCGKGVTTVQTSDGQITSINGLSAADIAAGFKAQPLGQVENFEVRPGLKVYCRTSIGHQDGQAACKRE